MKRNSLSRRLFLSSAVWTLLVLPLAGAVLISLYRDAVERSFDARLNLYLDYLIAITSPDQGIDITEPGSLGEPRFSLPSSGWYWEIRSSGGAPVTYNSVSLLAENLKFPRRSAPFRTRPRSASLSRRAPRIRPARSRTRDQPSARKTSSAAILCGRRRRGEIEEGLRLRHDAGGRSECWGRVVIATFFQVSSDCARSMRSASASPYPIRKAAHLEGNPPDEIKPLQEELNALIQSNRRSSNGPEPMSAIWRTRSRRRSASSPTKRGRGMTRSRARWSSRRS